MIEFGLADVESKGGGFLQIAGSYAYDWRAPIGARLLYVRIRDESLQLSKQYRLALPSYILEGGNGFDFQDDVNILVSPENAPRDFDVVHDYIKGKKLDLTVEGRIKIKN